MSKEPTHTTLHNINIAPNALYIKAIFNNKNTTITIDTGANICCINHALITKNHNITQTKNIQITAANNELLTLIGLTKIQININSYLYEIEAYIIKNLACPIIIGNNFLEKNNAIISFNSKTITLNYKIKIKLYTNKKCSNLNNITEKHINILELPKEYSLAHCISADLKMSKGIALSVKETFGDATPILSRSNPKVCDVIPIQFPNKLIYYLVTKNKYNQTPKIEDIKLTIKNLKACMDNHNDRNLSIPLLACGLDKHNWSDIKSIILNEFQNTNKQILVCLNNTPNPKDTTHDEIHNKHNNIAQIQDCEENINDKISYVYKTHKPGENVVSDGNCGIYALCNALNSGHRRITTIAELINLLRLKELPNYWWADDELASIADYYGFDTYIYNDSNHTGLIYSKDPTHNRPPIVLYNTNNNTHWIPGQLTNNKSTKIPKKYVLIKHTIPLNTAIENVQLHTKSYPHRSTDHPSIEQIYNNNDNTNQLQNHNNETPNESETVLGNQQVFNNNTIEQINNHNNKMNQSEKHKINNNALNESKNIPDDQITQNPQTKEIIYDNEGTIINISPLLNINQHNEVTTLIKRFIHLFTTDTSKIKPANIPPCEIKMKPQYTDPKFNAPHRISPKQREELKIQLEKLAEANIIRPIISKFAAPAFLVNKKEKGSYRLVVSYKELNDRVETDQYPLPRTTDLLRALEGSQYFSSLDLNSGFFQIPIKLEDQHKLAFTSVHGLMTFTRLPQGYKNSSAIFQRVLNESFSPLLYKSLIIYIDDLASFGKNFHSALNNLKQTFIILDKMNFSLKTNKCHFFDNEIKLLGHSISISGIKPLTRNVTAITQFKTPKNTKDVRSFLGMCSYYRRHIKDFAKIAHPLTELIKNNTKKITWAEEHESSFTRLKNLLTSEPLISHFNDNKKVFLTIDASLLGLGACMEQTDDNNVMHPVGYASRKLLANEKTYSSTTLELLGLCFGITYFREYLWGRHFTVFCDNISIQYYNNLKIPSARIARLTLKLLDFNFDIQYKKGKENKVADALSRNPINLITEYNDPDPDDPTNNIDIKTLQSNDKYCNELMKAIKGNFTDNKTKRKSRQFLIINEILYHKHFTPPNTITHLLVIPKSLVTKTLKSYHESLMGGHTGISRTIHKLQNKYYWDTLRKDTEQFIKSCTQCQQNKKLVGKPIGQLQPIPLTNRPMDRLIFDYLGPLPTSNKKKYVLVAACANTKYIFTKAVESATAESTVNFILRIISQWGSFKQFSSDRGTHFRNKLVSKITDNLGINQILSTAYSPETQGLVEKFNGTLCNSLKNYLNTDNQYRWSYILPYITLAYNATPQTSTKRSPFFLMHGFEPYFPIDSKILPNDLPYNISKSLKELNDIRKQIPQIVEKAQTTQKKYYDKAHRIINYNPGDLVMVQFPFNEIGKSPKLAPKYRGPFQIIKKISDLNYKVNITLNNKTTEDIIHVRRLKPYHTRINTM